MIPGTGNHGGPTVTRRKTSPPLKWKCSHSALPLKRKTRRSSFTLSEWRSPSTPAFKRKSGMLSTCCR